MTIKDIEKMENKFKVGDLVKVPEEIAHLTHDSKDSQFAKVVGLYNQFFNVEYSEGYQQSIQYKDADKVRIVA